MNPVAEFGIVTACHRGDFFMAKATCASIRRFMPDVPICVIVDGDFSISELERSYGVIPLRVDDCKDPRLHKMCARSTRSKLLAQWDGPFERYLWVDCDIVVTGDIANAERWKRADFWAMTSIQPGTVPDKNLRHYFMNPDLVARFDPGFDANRWPLFCDGAYVARRGALDFEEAFRTWERTLAEPTLFSWTKCQGLTNYLVFSAAGRGDLLVNVSDRQYIVPDHPRKATEDRFAKWGRLPDLTGETPLVVHFCGEKPQILNRRAYSSLFTAFRLQHCRNLGMTSAAGLLRILGEEARLLAPRLKRRFLKR
jgi:hypothetical protein